MISSTSMISNYVPLELINSILSRLPVKALTRFLRVSKEWSALINSSNFIKKHLNHSIETNSNRTLILKENSCIRHHNQVGSPLLTPTMTSSASQPKFTSLYIIGKSWTVATASFALPFIIGMRKRKTSRFGIHWSGSAAAGLVQQNLDLRQKFYMEPFYM